MIPLKTQAIEQALIGNWETAILLNKQILDENPEDIETLNRLAFAFTAMGKIKEAKQTYQRTLSLDEVNPIALKNLNRLKGMNGKATEIKTMQNINNLFLEETGKTKIVTLLNIAQHTIIDQLQIGQEVNLCIKRSKIFVLNEKKQFIGMLPDTIGKRLLKFLNGGNGYSAYIKAVEEKSVTIFIKEIKCAKRFKNQPSFSMRDKTRLTFPKNDLDGKRNKHAHEEEGSSDE